MNENMYDSPDVEIIRISCEGAFASSGDSEMEPGGEI